MGIRKKIIPYTDRYRLLLELFFVVIATAHPLFETLIPSGSCGVAIVYLDVLEPLI